MMAFKCAFLYRLAVLNLPFSIVLRILQLFCSDEDVDSIENMPKLDPQMKHTARLSLSVLTVVIMAAPL